MESRVDTLVSLVGNSREFHVKRVSYFTKKRSLFHEILCFTKLALACKSQFCMFRISRNKTFNKRNKTAMSNEKNSVSEPEPESMEPKLFET